MLLIGNGRVITRDQENPYLEDGAVVISGEKIKEVGSLTEMKTIQQTFLKYQMEHGGQLTDILLQMEQKPVHMQLFQTVSEMV